MSNATLRIPSYRHHKRTDQAVVTLNGRDPYLGANVTPFKAGRIDSAGHGGVAQPTTRPERQPT